ncbi:Aromatic peroxygenase 1 [Paraphaeosphaeria sporulosa]
MSASGDPTSLDLGQFKQLASMSLGANSYDLTVFQPFRGARFNHSVSTNGHYWAGPFIHFAVHTATYVFTYQHPEGYLDIDSLMAFEDVTRNANGEFEWKTGREHIPNDWYRRAIGDDFGIAASALGTVDALQHLPYMAVLGGNTGEPNTFTGVNVADLTGGVLNPETLLQGNNTMFLAFQAVSAVAPDILRGLVGNVLLEVQKLTVVLTSCN